MRCSKQHAACARAGPTSSSDMSNLTGESRQSALLKVWNGCRLSPVRYRDIVRQEFDLDAALRRHPGILLVDELAHSNIAGGDPVPRHPKRWQDIEELLDAGIDVWTTVNIQHLESLNDVVAQITGVRQRETLPDRIFDEADEVELIDLPPNDLLARLHAGKVYVPEEIGHRRGSLFPQAQSHRVARARAQAHGGSRRSLGACVIGRRSDNTAMAGA